MNVKTILRKVLLLTLILLLQRVNAQDNNTPSKAHIRLKVENVSTGVAIRWAVDTPIAWQKANKIGFILKRYTILRDGKPLVSKEIKELGKFEPLPLEEWKNLIATNDNAAIVAQALYGESFEVEISKKGDLERIINKSKEIEQRFSFALMAADLDFEIAKLAGWGYTDKEVKTNERYLYTIALNPQNNHQNMQIEKGTAIADISMASNLPKPIDFIGIFEDKQVTLAWDYKQFSDTYTSYFIEKSENNKDFTPISDLPVVQMKSNAQGMVYIDSLSQNDKKYSYRIKGKTIFGEFGPYSEIVVGEGVATIAHPPRITKYDINDNDVNLYWEFPENNEKDISGFRLFHSETDKQNSYKAISDNITPEKRNISTELTAPSNYYKIGVVGKNNKVSTSFAVLVQPNDTIPPNIPKDFKGKIDSLGIAHLSWTANTETDLEGYHIFRADLKGRELLRITPQAITTNSYKDTVQINNLGNKVYYYITATDIRKNQSEPSAVIELTKPDVIKPQVPVFKKYKIENGTITLDWIKSFSDDVDKHQLFRIDLDNNDSIPRKIFETDKIQQLYTYTDKDIQAGKRYRYYLKAIDNSGLPSDSSVAITLRNIDTRPTKYITNLTGVANKQENRIELLWRLNNTENIAEILIYRQEGTNKPTLWQTLPSSQNFVEDSKVMIGGNYTYLLKAILKTQLPTKTEKIIVEY